MFIHVDGATLPRHQLRNLNGGADSLQPLRVALDFAPFPEYFPCPDETTPTGSISRVASALRLYKLKWTTAPTNVLIV